MRLVSGRQAQTRDRAQSVTTPGRNKRRYQAPFEGTAARLNTGGMSEIVVATIPSFTRLWVSEKVLVPRQCPHLVLARERAVRLIKRRSEIVASGKLPEM
jgi:hypothetical protein